MMPPNGVIPTITKDGSGVITNVSFNYTEPQGKNTHSFSSFRVRVRWVQTITNNLLHGGERHKNAVLSPVNSLGIWSILKVYIDKAKDIIEK
jgi:hypothetical protein